MSSCRSCRSDLLPGARFCSACGTPVGPELISGTRSDTAGLWPEGERRSLSLLFCDLVGSTTLGQRLDVEDYTEVIEAYVTRAAGAIEQYGGYVAQVQGDGIVAYFGFPSANEDDAERAVRAGLAIHAALSEAGGLGRAGVDAIARVGIHTGVVVVNEVGGARRELLALGDTANTAARVESLSPPGRVGISETTRRLVADRFRITASGEHPVKGIEEPIPLFLVDGAAEDRGVRPDVVTGRVLVGRDQLLSTLDETLGSVGRDGRGASIAIVGEPGIGKSHFATVLLAGALERDCKAITVSCSAIEQSAAFAPIIDMLGRLLDLAPTHDPNQAAASMQASLSRHAIDLASTLPYLLQLSGLPASSDYPLPVLGAELQRARSLAAFEAVVVGVCALEPTVVLCEDVHWADQSTLEVLIMLAERARNCPLVLLVTSRPGFDVATFTEIVTLDRLDIDASRALVRARAGEAVVPDDVVDRLVARADGVPLFLEELTAAVIESGDLETIPETLKDSLSARLDRLGPARVLAQVSALIGRDVDRSLLRAVVDTPASEFDDYLAQLVSNGILLTDDARRYTFKHALIQDAAASSLVRKTQRRLHGDIVDALLESFPHIVEDEPGQLAYHCSEAERGLDAIGHYRRAAARAGVRFANFEAADLLSRALVEYDSLDDADRTRILEIELRAEYGGPLAGVHGLLGDPVVANYARLEALEADATDIGDRLAALLALTARYPQVAAMGALMDAGLKLLDIADTLEMPLFKAVGHMMYGLGATTISPREAVDHLEAVEQLAEAGHVPPPFSDYAPDLLVLAVATKSIVVGSMGRVSEAREQIASALHRSEVELAHPFSMGTALTLAATIHVWFSEPEACLAVAARAVELAQRHGFSNFEAMNLVQLGWALTATGSDGSDRVRTGLKLLATSTMSSYPHQLRVAAMEALLRGATREARQLLDEGFAFVAANGETGHLPQLHRIRGWVERDEGRPDKAAASLRAAYDIAAQGEQWLTAIDAARELFELGTADQPHALEMLRATRPRLIGAADLPAIIAADALLR